MKLHFVVFAAAVLASAASDPDANSVSKRGDSKELPEFLNLESFDKSVNEQLSFVEFFSPMCSHCKALAPTWEKTYLTYKDEMKKLNIQMRQVDCIASGDLCEREGVNAYPNLRIYAPVVDKDTGALKGKSKFVTTYPRALTRNPENFMKFMKNSVAEYSEGAIDLPSASKSAKVDQILKYLAGDAEQPEFVMFFPGTNEQWDETEKTDRSAFSSYCYDCKTNKVTWDKLSNQILTTVGTSHFGCLDNVELCEKLGLKTLTREGNQAPRLIMFLPKDVGIFQIDYEGQFEFEEIKRFAVRMFENHQYSALSPLALSDVMDVRKVLPFEPLELFYPLVNKVAIMLFYDASTVTEEDKAVLPHILDHIANSPFNLYLYTAKSPKYEEVINSQHDSMLEYISYNEDQPPYKFNKPLYLATSLTSKPTIIIFKDNSLISPVYQSFSPEDIRSVDRVLEFIDKNQYPLYHELTPALFDTYFNKDLNGKNDEKVVITFVDSENPKLRDATLHNMSLTAHEYHYWKQDYFFNKAAGERQLKTEKAEALKQQNADSVKVIEALRKEVPHLYDTNQVLFTFVDISKYRELARMKGLDIDNQQYDVGDTIVVAKDFKYYWSEDLSHNPLKCDPFKLTPTLLHLLDPKTVSKGSKTVNLQKKLVGSPYPTSLRYMDSIHEYGFFGYVFMIISLVRLGFFLDSRYRKRKNNASKGIIGVMSKDD